MKIPRTRAHSHSPAQTSKPNGLSWPQRHVLLQVLAVTSLPAPCQGQCEEEPSPGLAPLDSAMQNRGQQKNQLAPDWDTVVGYRRHMQLPFDAPRLGSMEMRPGLWGCEEERARSQVKAVCWSWRDVPTSVQARWWRVTHLGSKTWWVDEGSAWSHPMSCDPGQPELCIIAAFPRKNPSPCTAQPTYKQLPCC